MSTSHKRTPNAATASYGSDSHCGRLRLGEIFMIQDGVMELTCIHCLQRFDDFGIFTLHAHEHLHGIKSMFAQMDALPHESRRKKRSANATTTAAVATTGTPATRVKREVTRANDDDMFGGIETVFCDENNEPTLARASDNDDDDNDDDTDYAGNDGGGNSDDDTDDDDKDFKRSTQSGPARKRPRISLNNGTVEMKLADENLEMLDSDEAREYVPYLYNTTFERLSNNHLKCPKCDFNSSAGYRVQRHIFTHVSNKILKCTICETVLSKFDQIRSHVNSHAKRDAASASRRTPVPAKLKIEVSKENQFDDIKAQFVQNGFTIEDSADANKFLRYFCGINSFTKNDDNYLCPMCTYVSSKLGHVKRHYGQHFKQRLFTCLTCSKRFTSIDDSRKHMSVRHGGGLSRMSVGIMGRADGANDDNHDNDDEDDM